MIEFFHGYFMAPFEQYVFMRRALFACWLMAFSGVPLGTFLLLRRMSLMGEALSHGILPGLAVAFLLWGIWLPGMTIGGLCAGLCIALASFLVTRYTKLREDASFASFYILALALGILILSMQGGQMHIMHLLFGSILAVNQTALTFIMGISVLTIITLFLIYRPFVYECFDTLFARSMGISGGLYTSIFFVLVVCNLVASCQALGTLMALGLMIIPAASARLLTHRMSSLIVNSIIISMIASYGGLVLSYHENLPSGPTVILMCGVFYLTALLMVTVFRMYRHLSNACTSSH